MQWPVKRLDEVRQTKDEGGWPSSFAFVAKSRLSSAGSFTSREESIGYYLAGLSSRGVVVRSEVRAVVGWYTCLALHCLPAATLVCPQPPVVAVT